MHTIASFAKNNCMRKSTKILFVLFVLTLIPAIVLGRFVLAGVIPTGSGFAFNFEIKGIIGLALTAISNILGFILFFRFIMAQPVANAIFFSSLPLMLSYGAVMFLLVQMSTFENDTAKSIRSLLNLSAENAYNTILWAILISIIFILLMFANFFFLCKPVGKVEKIVSRLGDGKVRESKLKIGGGKQFNNIEHGLNKINNNFKNNIDSLNKVKAETRKFIPKQFFKFLGKESVAELELGNQVKKVSTLMSVKLRGVENAENMSLEENFNFLNSYLNVVSPIIRRFGGFIDKYFGEGILAVFGKAEDALDCAHAINRAVSVKNRQNKALPNINECISVMTSQVIFGIIGEQERKIPTIISNVSNDIDRLDNVCRLLNTKILFSDSVLNNLPLNYKFLYRYVGAITINDKEKAVLFEDLEVVPRDLCLKLIRSKPIFEKGILFYEKAQYVEAKDCFAEALKIAPNDKGCYIYYNKANEKVE